MKIGGRRAWERMEMKSGKMKSECLVWYKINKTPLWDDCTHSLPSRLSNEKQDHCRGWKMLSCLRSTGSKYGIPNTTSSQWSLLRDLALRAFFLKKLPPDLGPMRWSRPEASVASLSGCWAKAICSALMMKIQKQTHYHNLCTRASRELRKNKVTPSLVTLDLVPKS